MVKTPVAGLKVPLPDGRTVTVVKFPLPAAVELNNLNVLPNTNEPVPEFVTTNVPPYVTPVRPATASLLVLPVLLLMRNKAELVPESVNVLLMVSVPMEPAPGESFAPAATVTGPAIVPVPPS